MKAAIIADSTATLTEDIAQLPNVYQVDFSIRFDDGTEILDVSDDAGIEAFYEKMRRADAFPKTSQPSLNQYYEIYDDIIAKGYDTVYAFTIPASVSGEYRTAQMVSGEYADRITSHVFDTNATSFLNERFILDTLEMIDAGMSDAEIVAHLDWQIKNSAIYAVADNLDYLAQTGRLSTPLKIVGKALRICPLVMMSKEGKIVIAEKIRTQKKALHRVVERIEEETKNFHDGVYYILAHADALDKLETVQSLIKERLGDVAIRTGLVTPVIATYTGLGSLGIGYVPSWHNKH